MHGPVQGQDLILMNISNNFNNINTVERFITTTLHNHSYQSQNHQDTCLKSLNPLTFDHQDMLHEAFGGLQI